MWAMVRVPVILAAVAYMVQASNDTEVDVNDTEIFVPTPPPTPRPAGTYYVIRAVGKSTSTMTHQQLSLIPEVIAAHGRFYCGLLSLDISEHGNWCQTVLSDGSRRLSKSDLEGRRLNANNIRADYTATIPSTVAPVHITDPTTVSNMFHQQMAAAAAAAGITFNGLMDANAIADMTSSLASGIASASVITVGGGTGPAPSPQPPTASDAPTEAPTGAPTVAPTIAPTGTSTPTFAPTPAPPTEPTAAPTLAPTSLTAAPTAAATQREEEETSGASMPNGMLAVAAVAMLTTFTVA